jgi:hypothetical protein
MAAEDFDNPSVVCNAHLSSTGIFYLLHAAILPRFWVGSTPDASAKVSGRSRLEFPTMIR